MASFPADGSRSNGRSMENQGFMKELQPGMEEELLTSPESSAVRTSEIAPLQLESHHTSDRSQKGTQDGLKIIVTSSICFAVSVTIALILTIYLAPPQVPPHAAVVSDSELCSSTGEQLLKRGGSAVDAAIAVVLCEGLVNPHHSGIGGGGFMVVRRSKEATTHVIDFMDSAPEKLQASLHNLGKKAGISVGVPGMLRGLALAHEKFGKLRWIDVIMSVVELAYSPLNVSLELDQILRSSEFPEIKSYFDGNTRSMPNGQMNLTRLGWILQSVANKGADVFYEQLSDEIVKTVSKAEGVMSRQDLLDYKAVEREPVTSTFMGMAVESVPTPGSGPLLLLILNIMENLTREGSTVWNSSEIYHCFAEASKHSYYHQCSLGDSDFSRKNITSKLISKEYASFLASRVDPYKTHDDADYYLPHDDLFSLTCAQDRRPGTSHISVIDPNDDMVSVTVSLNGPFGSGLITESGIILNSHMLNFDTARTNENNIPEKGKRPLVPLSPTIVYNPHRPCGRRFALGGANGESLLSGLAEVLMNIFGHGMTLQQAIDSARFYVHVKKEDEIHYEDKFPEEILQMLKEKGHKCVPASGNVIVHAVAKINSTVYGQADQRSEGNAVVY